MNDDCLFCRMLAGDIPLAAIAENEGAFAIRDINPRAPVHVLIVPREHIPTVRDLTLDHAETLGHIFTLATHVAEIEGVADAGYRLAFNCGDDAGQTIYHIHLHLLGGRLLGPEG